MSCPQCGSNSAVSGENCPACGRLSSVFVATGTVTPPSPDTTSETRLHTAGVPPPPDIHPETHFDPNGRSAVPPGTVTLRAGAPFGRRYRILRMLGQGGMGVVYQAWDEELGLAVALKTIRPEVMSDPVTAAAVERRFKRELLLARQVTHPHVVRIHDLGEVDGVKYLTMPFIEGQTLSSVMAQSGRLSVGRALQIVREIAGGLMAAHGAGVVHRDLKPENVMLDADGQAIIMDFGISRSLTGTGAGTAMGSVVGTLEYMSPEQAKGEVADQRADIYALGLMLYDMLVGRRRFATGANALLEAMGRMQQAPAAIRTLESSVPEPVEGIVARCLEPDPAKRYQAVSELLTDLNRLDSEGYRSMAPVRSWWIPGFAASWPRAARVALLAAVALLVAAPAVLLVTILANRASAPAVPAAAREPMSILIADFQNLANDAVFEGSLEQALAIAMEGAPFITTFPRRDALASARAAQAGSGNALDEETARLVALREEIKVILAGSIDRRGSSYVVEIRAVDPANGQVLATASGQPAGKDDVLEVLGSLAASIRGALGDGASDDPRSGARETLTAGSLEAVRQYALARELESSYKDEEAIVHYKAAIAEDPEFGRAYAGWGNSAFRLGRENESKEAWSKALSLIDRMTEREKFRTLGVYYGTVSRNYEKAIDNYEALVKQYPADGAGHNNLALAYFNTRDFQKALDEGRRVLDIYPKKLLYRGNYALYAMYAGNFREASAQAERIVTENPGYYPGYVPLAIGALTTGDAAGARESYTRMASTGAPGASLAAMGFADIALNEGRYREAMDGLSAGIARDRERQNQAGVAAKEIAQAEAHMGAGETALAIAAVDRALELSREEAIAVPAARLLVQARRPAEASRIAEELGARLQPQPRAYAKLIEGEIALAEGRSVQAIEAFTSGIKLADLWLLRFVLGVAYVQANHFAEALSELEACHKRRGEATAIFLDDVPTFRRVVPLYYWLGRAQEALRINAAAANYKVFLSLRSPATTDPLAADAARRLRALGAS